MTGRRVLDAEGPTVETSVSASGSVRGTQANESITFVAKPVPEGALHGKGHGLTAPIVWMMAIEPAR